MLKNLIATGIFFLISVSLFADDPAPKAIDRGWTLGRLCFTKGAVAFPEKCDVYGVNVGLPESYNYNCVQKIYGWDMAFISVDSRASGFQMGMTNWSKGSCGFQLSMANLVEDFAGCQIALANYTKESTVFQLGIFNFGRKNSCGFQLGLLNFMDKGFLPFFPLINFSL